MKGSKRDSRREYWRTMIAQQVQSGLPVHAFCVQEGITDGSFYHWRKRLGSSLVSFALVEARPAGQQSKTAVEIVLGTGERIQVTAGADAGTVRMVLAVLRERA